MNLIKLRPHHLLDIVRDFGNGIKKKKMHPWGASVAEVTEKVLFNIDQDIILVSQVDSICETCSKLEKQICVARISDNLLMREYNDNLDTCLFRRMKLEEGQRISIRDFLVLVKNDLDNIVALFTSPNNNPAIRLNSTRNALKKLL
jgi:hypothetical protein